MDLLRARPVRVVVDLEPIGRRVAVTQGTTLLSAAQSVGVALVSLCGGEGWCESCLVRLLSGELSPFTSAEKEALTEAQLAAGYRLACQAMPTSDVKIDIPPESLTTPQRLQVEGQEVPVALDPPLEWLDVTLDAPTLRDLRSDSARLQDALGAKGHAPARLPLSVMTGLSSQLRALGWSVRLVLRHGELVGLLPVASGLAGLAIDIGTTKLAAYLLDMTSGETLAKGGAMNPQIAYGEDVVSRIAYSRDHADGRRLLQTKLVETLNELVSELCHEAGPSPEQIIEAVVVGNTAMHHLFAGLPVEQLGLSPYVPAVGEAFECRTHEVGLRMAPGGTVHLLPNIAGFVGADHVAVILATEIWQTDRTTIAVDIGTNTEITLATKGRLLSCSCASGPAFEGAHIRDGMRAAHGAIERVQIADNEVRVYTIGDQPPVGICGSGILDAVAEMRASGIIDHKGALQRSHPLVQDTDPLPQFQLVPAARTGHGQEIALTRKDVNEIQLAKAAIRVGIDTLLAEAGIEAAEVEELIIAGAFGTYIDVGSAIRVGMLPELPADRFRQVGNAAGSGAKQALLSQERREAAGEIAHRVEYVELTTHPSFQREFVARMYL